MLRMIIISLALSMFVVTANANQPGQAELEKWFASDDLELPASQSAREINEGQLVFLNAPPQKSVHHHQNKMIIDAQSLSSGWVRLQQCHHNLDKVSRAQILFRKETIRQLKVTSFSNIDEVWVKDNTIQLRNITDNARLCVEAVSQALVANQDGSFSLHNGPFMRRFLDGYYPMHVSMEVRYTGTGLQLSSVSPVIQQGFQVKQNAEHVSYEAWFEGRLRTELRFVSAAM